MKLPRSRAKTSALAGVEGKHNIKQPKGGAVPLKGLPRKGIQFVSSGTTSFVVRSRVSAESSKEPELPVTTRSPLSCPLGRPHPDLCFKA